MNNPTTADRIDQLIWGEIPVAHDDQYRPYAWRNTDDHRTSRWTEKVTLDLLYRNLRFPFLSRECKPCHPTIYSLPIQYSEGQ